MHGEVTRLLAASASAIVLSLCVPSSHAQSACDADLDDDGSVGASDLAGLLAQWGACGTCAADLDGSGGVDAADLGLLLSFWAEPCNPLPWATVMEHAPDPAVVRSGSLRAAIVATGLPWRVRDNLTQIELVLVPPGSYGMGCSPSLMFGCGSDEDPVHPVTLTDAFYLGRFEVTQAQWTARMGVNPSHFQSASPEVPASQVPDRPVEQVSWNMVQGFLSVTGFRAPTEAEWEYAYRAGTTTAFHDWSTAPGGTNDDAQVGAIAWYSGNSGSQTHPVGLKAANGFGLYDMSGNVFEWVSDWYLGNYYSSSPIVNPTGPASGTARVLRGASWGSGTGSVRSSNRVIGSLSSAGNGLGLRVARDP